MLKNKKIIIVGGTSGIGLAVAQAATEAGAVVVVASRSADRLSIASHQLSAYSLIEGNVETYLLDASIEKDVAAFYEDVGAFDHLVMTIKGAHEINAFAKLDLPQARHAFDAKFWGQYYLARYGAPKIRHGGSITLTSGIGGQKPYLGYSTITVINGAIDALCKTLAIELAPIRVNTVCPGFVATQHDSVARQDALRSMAITLPVRHIASPQSIASAYLYLMTSTYSTGTVLVVDGGALQV